MTEPLRVLMVEDSHADEKLVLRALQLIGRPIEHLRVETAEELRSALAAGPWDIVLSDWAMPKFSALAALEVVKTHQLDLPFVIVSGTIGEEAAVEAVRAGAHDYVLKDRLSRLAPAVERECRERESRQARLAAEGELRKSRLRFERLSESGVVGIAITNLQGEVLEANDTYLSMLGYTREDFDAGLVNWAKLTPPDWRASDERATELLRANGAAPAWRKELMRKDGSRVPVLVGAVMLDPPHCIALVADLTEQRKVEEALARSEEQFRQAQKMEAVGRLAGGVAHDFNNLLSVILTYSELGMDSLPPDAPLRADLGEIRKAGERASALTKQLLAFSRQQILDVQVIDLNDLIESTSKMLGRLIGEDVELKVVAAPTLGTVRADTGQVEQVLMNLAINARDAMPQGGKLTIETQNVDLDAAYATQHHGVEPGRYVMVAVSDTGIGMDRATQTRIFEPFFTTKEKGKGTGLGLSTVFGIVQQSKGHVWVYSELGKGTTFKVYLPRSDEGVAEIGDPHGELLPLRGNETILLVEDEDQIRTVVFVLLRSLGYRVLEARSGGEALKIAERKGETIDLLLTDVVMPRMSGPELAAKITRMLPKTKVLCMSGYTDEAILRHGILDAGLGFIQKPITPTKLARKLRDILETPGLGGSR